MSEMNLVVRSVSGVDLRAATELLFHQQQANKRNVTLDTLRPMVQAALEDASHIFFFGAFHEGLPGFQHGKMVGVLIMNVSFSLEHAGEVGWIQELFVREDYRRKGLGDRLITLALEWAQARGLRALNLELGQGHDPDAATNLYVRRQFELVRCTRLTKTFP